MPNLTLTRSAPAGTGLQLLSFDAPLEGHAHPGQFCTVHLEGHKPAYFALANSPGAPVQLLVKIQGDTAEELGQLEPGAVVEFSDPIGRGFPLPAGDTRDLVILATGSGISAVRPVIAAELAAGLPRPVHFLYGVFTTAHLSFTDEVEAWRKAGVDVHIVLSEPEPGWDGATGFVQHAAHGLGFVRDDVTVVLCGFPGMVEDARKAWTEAGTPEAQLLTNF